VGRIQGITSTNIQKFWRRRNCNKKAVYTWANGVSNGVHNKISVIVSLSGLEWKSFNGLVQKSTEVKSVKCASIGGRLKGYERPN